MTRRRTQRSGTRGNSSESGNGTGGYSGVRTDDGTYVDGSWRWRSSAATEGSPVDRRGFPSIPFA